jgi:hypothetical protein
MHGVLSVIAWTACRGQTDRPRWRMLLRTMSVVSCASRAVQVPAAQGWNCPSGPARCIPGPARTIHKGLCRRSSAVTRSLAFSFRGPVGRRRGARARQHAGNPHARTPTVLFHRTALPPPEGPCPRVLEHDFSVSTMRPGCFDGGLFSAAGSSSGSTSSSGFV